MRARFVSADGAFQYKNIPKIMPEYQFAIFPRLRLLVMLQGLSEIVPAKRRRYEFYGKNENGIIEYREIVE